MIAQQILNGLVVGGVYALFALGFTLQPMLAPGAGLRAFGHPGAGGSLGFADPEAGIGFGYVSTRMRFDLTGDPRTRGLVEAVYGALPG